MAGLKFISLLKYNILMAGTETRYCILRLVASFNHSKSLLAVAFYNQFYFNILFSMGTITSDKVIRSWDFFTLCLFVYLQ